MSFLPVNNRQGGFFRLIFIIVILIIVFSYFGIDIRGIVENPTFQQNVQYVWGVAADVWNNYLRDPFLYFWHNIFIALIWETLIPAAVEQIDAPQAATST